VLLTTRVGLGTLRLPDAADAADASDATDGGDGVATIHAALDAGVRLLDTARAYGGREALLGRALASHPAGADAFVITKGGMARPAGRWLADGRAATLRRDCEASAAALGRPIDLYLVHAPDPGVKWATTVRALARLLDDGLVRAVGVSNVNLLQLDEALALAPIAAVEVAFSLLDDEPLRSGVLARASERGLSLIAHSPLGGPRRARSLLASPAIAAIAERRGVPRAAVALAALLGVSREVAVIPGARTPEAAREIARASFALDEDERAALAAQFPTLRERVVVAASPERGEIVLVMGLPGAGKSAAAEALVARGYERLNRDELGGSLSAIARRLDERLAAGARRVVLDNTYVTRAARAEPIAVAARRGVAVRGLFIDVALADAQVNVVARMLAAHGRLLAPEELRRGRDNTALAPSALGRLKRALEPPAADEGFASLELRPFARVPRAQAGRAARLIALELADAWPAGELAASFVFGWAPDAPPELDARLAARAAGVALCRHGGGSAVCWCRPPLPGLPLALAHAHALDLAASELHGVSAAHRALAAAVGARFVAHPATT
jgi:aryl-alcohol dehydrogenase-like predicted oxidoreductase